MRLHLIRHARPVVDEGVCYGSSDLFVSEEMQRQAVAELTPLLPERTPIYSSPLRRCSGLAEALAASLHAGDVIADPRLAEMHFGAWEMQTWDTIPRVEVDAWAADLTNYRPGGGENVIAVAERVRAFLDELRASRKASAIIVCHAGTIRMLSACLQTASVRDAAIHAAGVAHRIAYGELTTIDC